MAIIQKTPKNVKTLESIGNSSTKNMNKDDVYQVKRQPVNRTFLEIGDV